MEDLGTFYAVSLTKYDSSCTILVEVIQNLIVK